MGQYTHQKFDEQIQESNLKILYYNWVQFDNEKKEGGGVNIYQKNLIDYLVKNTNNEIYFLSSGWKYDPIKKYPYGKQ